MNLTENSIEVGGIKTRILRGGSGANTVLFLHGWGSCSDKYREAISEISEDSFKVVIPDLPGFGGTVRPSNTWGVEEYANWIRQLIKELGLWEVILCGHSFGGRISIYLAANKPEEIKSVLLFAAAGVSEQKKIRNQIFAYIAKKGKKILNVPVLKSAIPFTKKVIYKVAGSYDYLQSDKMKDIFLKVIAEDLTKFAMQIKIPTAILWGELDTATPIADAHKLKKLIPSAELKIIKQGTHTMYRDNPKVFASAVTELINKLSV